MKKSDSGTATKQPVRLRELTDQLQSLEARLRLGGGPDKIERQHQQGKQTARERIKRLLDKDSYAQEIGLLVKDLDSGLVDFPSERDGRPVLLCWQLGEDEVAFRHGYEDGYAGRRPI